MTHLKSWIRFLGGWLQNLCPYCFKGDVFAGIFKINPLCPECGHQFENESGYFAGAMFLSTFVGGVLAVPTFLIATFWLHAQLPSVLFILTVEILVTSPIIFFYSRLLWIYLEKDFEKWNF